jgi:hypothetical protein
MICLGVNSGDDWQAMLVMNTPKRELSGCGEVGLQWSDYRSAFRGVAAACI